MADNEEQEEEKKPPFPPPPPFPFPPPPDWYDGYDHRLPPKPPVPPRPYPYHIAFPPPPPPHKLCPECRSKNLEKYGFIPVVGGHYYTSTKSACCPAKVKITKITTTTIYFEDKNGTPGEKSYHDFMTSSWKDRSL